VYRAIRRDVDDVRIGGQAFQGSARNGICAAFDNQAEIGLEGSAMVPHLLVMRLGRLIGELYDDFGVAVTIDIQVLGDLGVLGEGQSPQLSRSSIRPGREPRSEAGTGDPLPPMCRRVSDRSIKVRNYVRERTHFRECTFS
jgi:hypothetical protein